MWTNWKPGFNIDINIDVNIENIENVYLSVNDRNNICMSSDFACEHLFDPIKTMRSSEINEIAKIIRFHIFFVIMLENTEGALLIYPKKHFFRYLI